MCAWTPLVGHRAINVNLVLKLMMRMGILTLDCHPQMWNKLGDLEKKMQQYK